MASRLQPGDLFEVSTARGLAYIQYLLSHTAPPVYGALVRVLAGTHAERPTDPAALAAGPDQFVTFFPVGAAVRQKAVAPVGRAPVPPGSGVMPRFKNGAAFDPVTRKATRWWVWDGTNEVRVDPLTPEQARYPSLGVINFTLLVERIEGGYRSEDDA